MTTSHVVGGLEALAATIKRLGVEGLPDAVVQFDPDTATEKLDDGAAGLWLTPTDTQMAARSDALFSWSFSADVLLARRVSADRAEVPGLVAMLEQLAQRLAGRALVDAEGAVTGWVITPADVMVTALSIPDLLYVAGVYVGALTVLVTDKRLMLHAGV